MAYISTPVTDLSTLIAAPVLASADADAQAAKYFLQFLESFAFRPATGMEGAERELAYFTFGFNYVQNGQPAQLVVSLPILSLVPLPLLNLSRARYDYSLQIVDVRTDPDGAPPRVRAMFCQPSLPGTMGVRAQVRSSDLPAGIERLLNLAADAVQTHS